MQKIIEQKLTGSKESADLIAEYTWGENEIAWYFCMSYHDVFKVQFTSEHWLAGNKWGWDKIYQYKYLEDSGGDHELLYTVEDGINHGNEVIFYTTKKEAINRGVFVLNHIKNTAIKKYNEDMKRLTLYNKIKAK